ncbi:cytochrome P450 [Piptocephalis cylindrospora]|uniref:Cytochrome P450 n=1 Tax=Piptocephalis cylindrospora TaxID=1907219 RepID=A0A4P9Y7L6_9FUNG|nr:cytochrome P450 [Piptocephalis cylindrospora]|eukprot:RKP15078.1 cytochrome P450 [Piptocephalis cylindrospora]
MIQGLIQVVLGIGFLGLTHALYRARQPNRPGPPGYPIFGNLLQMGSRPLVRMSEWAKKYGGVYYLRMGFIDWMVVSTPEAMHDVLSKQGATFASRPHQLVLGDILSNGGHGVVAAPYGPRWNANRRFFTSALSKLSVQSYEDSLLHESRHLCRNLMVDMERHGGAGFPIHRHHQAYAFNIILTMSYGVRYASAEHPRCAEQLQVNDDIFQMIGPKYFIVDLLPFLRCFLPHLERNARKLHATMYGFIRERFAQFCQEEEDINARIPNTMCKYLAAAVRKGELAEDDAHVTLGEAFAAGLDNSSSSLTWLTLALAAHVDVQKKAQEEMDRVVGRDRMPTQNDLPNLPYLRCILQEATRFRGPAQVLFPRATTEDTVYQGVTIRKGTWVMPSIYAAHHVFSHLEDPDVFRPERWESNPKTLMEEVMGKQSTRVNWNFGTGRRVCPGLYLADISLSLTLAQAIWCFTIKPGEGESVCLETMGNGTNISPPNWRIRYIPRGDYVKDMLQTEDSSTRARTLE